MMNYEVFKNVIVERIGELLPPIYANCKPEVQVVMKVNEKKDALILNSDIKDRGFISPTIYLDDAYEEFCECEDLDLILCKLAIVVMQYTGHFFPAEADIDFSQRTDSIVMNLINTERNQDLLGTVPHKNVMDLSIIYRIIMGHGSEGIDSVLVTNSLMDELGITLEDLHKRAYINTMEIFPAEMARVTDLFYVMTNNYNVYGATTMLYEEAMAGLAKQIGSGFYIIPTSIHEVLILPEKYGQIEMLISMLEEGNRMYTEENELLSNSIYFYDYRSESISKCASYCEKEKYVN